MERMTGGADTLGWAPYKRNELGQPVMRCVTEGRNGRRESLCTLTPKGQVYEERKLDG